jgi:hypothetical protein
MGRKRRRRVRKIHQYLHGRPLSAPLLRQALKKNENQRGGDKEN